MARLGAKLEYYKKLKGVCGPAIISAMFGITEPAIYGVTLQFKRPFILACLASGIGGAIIRIPCH